MKITFQNSRETIQDQNNINRQKPLRQSAQGCFGMEENPVFHMEIGNRRFDEMIAGNGMYSGADSLSRIQQAAGLSDAQVQQDYMTLMSNIMSEEDYKKLQEEGFSFRQIEPDETVTIVDKIKAEMAKAGVQITGYNDDLDLQMLSEALGSRTLAQEISRSFARADLPLDEEMLGEIARAWEMVCAVAPPTDGTIQLMLQENKDPEIENYYLAQSSGAGSGNRSGAMFYVQEVQGYYAQTAVKDGASEEDAFQNQIDGVIRKSGREPDEESRRQAKWLLERNLPLTEEKMRKYVDLTKVSFPVSEKLFADAAADAAVKGKSPVCGNLAAAMEEDTIYEKAERLMDRFVRDMQLQDDGGGGLPAREGLSAGALAERRLLEEVRLHMTSEANIRLIRSGFAIDTAPMEEFVEALKAAEREVAESLFPKDPEAVSKYRTYSKVNEVVKELPGMPAQLLGSLRIASVSGSTELTTLSEMQKQGQAMIRRLEAAKEGYETLMTSPRADMGDSILRAFGNVDEILRDLGYETTEENRKAVRILGYNRMEINPENIDKVSEARELVESVINKMTPASVLRMIRDGIQPLERNFEELNRYFEEKAESYEEKAESYSRFLYRMEKSGDITEAERESFIGIYRMLHQIEKKDGAAVGGVLNTGAELQFSNLLAAARSGKFGSMDVRLSDSEERYIRLVQGNNAIDRQIETAYAKQELEAAKQAGQAGEEAFLTLERAGLPANVENLLAVTELLKESAAPYAIAGRRFGLQERKAREEKTAENGPDILREADSEAQELLRAADGLWEQMDHPEAFSEAFGEVMASLEAEAKEEAFRASGYLDVRNLQLLARQFHISGKLAQNHEFFLPMEIDGQEGRLHLVLERSESEKGRMEITTQTAGGTRKAELFLQDGIVTGFLYGSGQEEVRILTRAADIFSRNLRDELSFGTDARLTVVDLLRRGEGGPNTVRGKKVTDQLYENTAQESGSAQEAPDRAKLLQIAKLWIRAVAQKEAEYEN
ncbi:MAG: hypothetical protein J5898_11770 [Lachnospiraceae bacterium]|nr:hypothetical protein [Lachnospiraceae bacterium]